MREQDFSEEAPGALVRTIEGQLAFVPAPLPPQIDLSAVALPLGEAMQAVGELRGACRRLQNPLLLVRPLQRQEALTSSAMEGTYTTADNLLLAEAGAARAADDSTREVLNYLRALKHSEQMLNEVPICHRLITEAHGILLSGLGLGRGAQKRPGEYKREQNWIGGRTIDRARYVPPPPRETQECMNYLERYINREDAGYPTPLMDLALVHYQLEAIHPFADGNGRVGRMLISLMSVQNRLLEMPVLYMSPALEAHKDEYIDLMFAVSAQNEWTPWLIFFFGKVCETCRQTISTIDRLIALQEDYRRRAGEAMRSSSIINLVDMLFEQPAISVREAAERLGITDAGARKVVEKLVGVGMLAEYQGSWPRMYLARGVMDAASPAHGAR